MCCKRKHVISAAEFIHYVLPPPCCTTHHLDFYSCDHVSSENPLLRCSGKLRTRFSGHPLEVMSKTALLGIKGYSRRPSPQPPFPALPGGFQGFPSPHWIWSPSSEGCVYPGVSSRLGRHPGTRSPNHLNCRREGALVPLRAAPACLRASPYPDIL